MTDAERQRLEQERRQQVLDELGAIPHPVPDSIKGRRLPGGGIIDDDRTLAQVRGTVYLVVMTDRFLSRMGQDIGIRRSLAAWPVYIPGSETTRMVSDNLIAVQSWVQSRSDALRVRVVRARTYRPHLHAGDHLHIYATDHATNHPIEHNPSGQDLPPATLEG